MRAIFISYRRSDAEGQAGRLFDDLKQHFGADAVFMDVAGVEAGRDFRKAIDDHVSSCGVLLAIIGKSWLTAANDQGVRRLDDPRDYVHLETASALKRDIPVIPVLVQGASMPAADQLPDNLKDLTYRNAVELTHARWNSDVAVLIKALEPIVSRTPKASPGGAAAPSRKSSRVALIAGGALLLVALVGFALYSSSRSDHRAASTAPPAGEQPTSPSAQASKSPVQDSAPPLSKPEATPAPGPRSGLKFRDWEGTWNLRWKFGETWHTKTMTVKARPSGIDADYELGTLAGRFEGGDVSTAVGLTTNTTETGVTCASGKQTGSFQLTLAKDGQKMEGWWDVCSEGTKWPWEARRQLAPPGPAVQPAPSRQIGNEARVRVVNVNSGLCLTVAGGAKDRNVQIVQYPCDDDLSRFWSTSVVPDTDLVTIKNLNSGLCLTIAGGGSERNTPAVQYLCDGDPSRNWNLRTVDGRTFRLVNAHSNLCLTIAGGVVERNAVAVQYPCDGDPSRDWQIRIEPR